MVAPLSEAFESCVLDSQSVEIFDELERIEELDRISEELLERASEELEIWAELLETFSLELLSLKLDELDCAMLELLLAEELLGSSELEEIWVPEQAV